MSVAEVFQQVQSEALGKLQSLSGGLSHSTYHFNGQAGPSDSGGPLSPVQKSVRRTVVSLRFSTFVAHETVRGDKRSEGLPPQRSPELARIVPPRNRYAYDVIAHVGRRTFLEGRALQEVQRELAAQSPPIPIPLSSLYDLQLQFLFHLGELHRKAAPALKEYLRARGDLTWICDGTLEPGTPVFFAVQDAREGLLLTSSKMPTENADDIAACFRETATLFGEPQLILHDLSPTIAAACQSALPKIPHRLCHQHWLAVLGEALYEAPQKALSQRLRSSKLMPHLKDQRRAQIAYLQERLQTSKASLLLPPLLAGNPPNLPFDESLGREVLLALQFWILDYPAEGHRQGFPFDPYPLYLHRRLVRARDALARLLSRDAVRTTAPKVLFHLLQQINLHCDDPEIIQAAAHYEAAFLLFERTRDTLRLFPTGPSPMHEPFNLSPAQSSEIHGSLQALRTDFHQQALALQDPQQKKLYATAAAHLDKYWRLLLPADPQALKDHPYRTTGALESHWCAGKRTLRHMHGRSQLTREFFALPSEFMLVPNLRIPSYVDLALGRLESLPAKLAEAGGTSGPFSHWLRTRKPSRVGVLSQKLLRADNFLDKLLDLYDSQCQSCLTPV